jgi:hypothetical protein
MALGFAAFAVCAVPNATAQTKEKVAYFQDSIAEKGDRNHIIRLNGGSSWVLAEPTRAVLGTDVLVVTRDVMVNGQPLKAAWFYVGGEEIPAKHVEGLYPVNAAFLTRVVGIEDQGTKLRLADGTQLAVARSNKSNVNRWPPPYKALLTGNNVYLYNLKNGTQVSLQLPKR